MTAAGPGPRPVSPVGAAVGAAGEQEAPVQGDAAAVLDVVEARLLGQPRTLRRRQVSSAASISLLSARRFWHALGFPNVGDEDLRFTRSDLYALRTVVSLVRDGVFDEATAMSMTRALGRTSDRLAVWQTQLMAEMATAEAGEPAGGAVPPDVALAAAVRMAELADDLEPLLVYAWRRHLAAAVSRMVSDAAPSAAGTAVRSIGFADLVSFTRLVRESSERHLARVVQRFEALASDIVTSHGGQVVKTVGDAVLYLTPTAGPGAAIALELVDAIGGDDLLPPVRVGMATGPVLSRLGDVFGTAVNLASRLTAVARPGGVVVDDATAEALGETSGLRLTAGRPRALRGLGSVVPWTLARAPQGVT